MNKKLLEENIVKFKTPEDLKLVAKLLGKNTVSYSQFSLYSNCPHSWKLEYIDKVKLREPNMYLVFGTSIHEVMQTYLTQMYDVTAKSANEMNLNSLLMDTLKKEYKSAVEQSNKHFSTQYEIAEFYKDGVEILDYLKKHRSAYFSRKECGLVGIEVPIIVETDENENVLLNGFIDVVLYEQNKYRFLDIKTSTRGWNKYQKADQTKIAQLILYKKYFGKQYHIPAEDIDVEYFIVKRKLYEGLEYPQKRIQIFSPASGKVSINRIEKNFKEFIKNSFNPDGSYNTSATYTKNKTACRFCPFKGTDFCK